MRGIAARVLRSGGAAGRHSIPCCCTHEVCVKGGSAGGFDDEPIRIPGFPISAGREGLLSGKRWPAVRYTLVDGVTQRNGPDPADVSAPMASRISGSGGEGGPRQAAPARDVCQGFFAHEPSIASIRPPDRSRRTRTNGPPGIPRALSSQLLRRVRARIRTGQQNIEGGLPQVGVSSQHRFFSGRNHRCKARRYPNQWSNKWTPDKTSAEGSEISASSR